MKDGYGAPFVKATFGGVDIQGIIESFEYISSEEDDDNAEFNIRLDDPKELDKPQYQEGVMWTVTWGFINGAFKVKKIWCYEVKPEFSDNAILITISFHNKAYSLRQRDSKTVHTDSNLYDVVHKAGKIHGVTTKVEVPGPDGQPIQVLTTDSLQSLLKTWSQQQIAKDSADTKLFGSTDSQLFDQVAPGPFDTGPDVNYGDLLAQRQLIRDMMAGNFAQGNKTDRQFINELGMRQPGGQYILDGTDDEAVLKQRNFNQKPIRSWTYGDDTGDLVSFCPESKGSSKNGSAINLGYDGWDRNNKTYFQGDMNATVEPELDENAKKTLAKYKKQLQDLKFAAGDAVLKHNVLTHLAGDGAISDHTNRVINLSVPITVADKRQALQATIDYFEPQGNNKNFNDPNSMDNAFADNARDEAELKMNPGTLVAIGDPTIFKGKIFTILNVGKKYSGNYYITKASHKIAGDHYYSLHLEFVRQGHNSQTNSSYINTQDLGQNLNKQIGPGGPATPTKIPPISENPQFKFLNSNPVGTILPPSQ